MTRYTCGTTLALIFLALVNPVYGQNYLVYSPKPAATAETLQKEDLLVQEIQIKRGDTLSGISRRFNGKASYYSQILLFNEIKNPNLIYTGNSLKVPLARKKLPHEFSTLPIDNIDNAMKNDLKGAKVSTESVDTVHLSEKKQVKKRDLKKKPVIAEKNAVKESGRATNKPVDAGFKAITTEASKPAVLIQEKSKDKATAEKLFEQAVKAYKMEDCGKAVELFDQYLTNNAASPLAADASLYKAECYLKLSGK